MHGKSYYSGMVIVMKYIYVKYIYIEEPYYSLFKSKYTLMVIVRLKYKMAVWGKYSVTNVILKMVIN